MLSFDGATCYCPGLLLLLCLLSLLRLMAGRTNKRFDTCFVIGCTPVSLWMLTWAGDQNYAYPTFFEVLFFALGYLAMYLTPFLASAWIYSWMTATTQPVTNLSSANSDAHPSQSLKEAHR